jgi:3-dehydroquinate synthase
VLIKRGLLKDTGCLLKKFKLDQKLIVITNRTVERLWYRTLKISLKKSKIPADLIVIPDGEKYKNLHYYDKIITRLISLKADRHSTLITFGGGVIGDLGGFVASTYMRGINLVHVPTTLVAQIDSSIGGKLAVDHAKAKNLIGSFYNPNLILTDPDVLSTLSDKEFLNGLFEAIKIGLINNRNIYYFIVNNLSKITNQAGTSVMDLVRLCTTEKIKIVEKDPFDKNLRMIFNFGHTFGHALETAGGYKNIGHGEAVGWGMLLAMHISSIMGLNRFSYYQEPYELIESLLNRRNIRRLDPDKLWKTIRLDKKAKGGQVRFILLKKIGKHTICNISREIFKEAFKRL